MKSHAVLLNKLSLARFALSCLSNELQKEIKEEGKQNEVVENVLRNFLYVRQYCHGGLMRGV